MNTLFILNRRANAAEMEQVANKKQKHCGEGKLRSQSVDVDVAHEPCNLTKEEKLFDQIFSRKVLIWADTLEPIYKLSFPLKHEHTEKLKP